MTRPIVLITGGAGLLGINWACALRDTHDIVLGTHVRQINLRGTRAIALALDNAHALTHEVERIAPAIIVHTAGITSVDECELEPERARHVYEDLSRNVAHAALQTGARLIQISTDHLFAGTRAFSTEEETPQPVNAYARAKLAAEHAVAEAHPGALIVRTNFFGWGHRYRQSFSDWIYYALKEGKPVTMFDDVFVTPTLADRVALYSHALLDAGASGIYNVVGDERISKYDFAIAIADAFGLPKALVQRGKIAASQLAARRPPDMSLDNRKARQRLGTPLGTVAEHLRHLKEQDAAGRRAELLKAVPE